MGSETTVVETLVGLWTESDYTSEDFWKGLCTAYRSIRKIRYEKKIGGENREYRSLINSMEVMP